MDKTLAGLIGAGLALAASPAGAAPTPPASVVPASSYADLLKPVSNARAVLEALYQQAQDAPQAAPDGLDPPVLQVRHHHHHHHHHRRYHHHHRRYLPF